MLKFSGSSCLIGGPNESWDRAAPHVRGGRKTGTVQPQNRADRSHVASRESRRRSDTPSTTLCNKGGRGLVHEVRCTRSSRSGTRRVRPPTSRRRKRGEWCQQTLRQACSQAYPGSARCVQSFDDSLDSASRKTYRISLRSSSLWEPRHPSLKVLQR